MTTKLAHELKNPLAAIKSLVQVERARSVDDKSQRRLDVALGEVDRISAILREYLDLAMHGVLSENVKLDAVRAKKPAKPPKKGQDTKAPAARAGTRSS